MTELGNKLHAINARFFHATNFIDFKTYWKEQSVVARSVLENSQSDFTRFFSDSKDRELGVWNKTFGNLSDMGVFTSLSSNAVPNAYGPITLVFSSDIWRKMPGLQITRRSITTGNPQYLCIQDIDLAFDQDSGKPKIREGYRACEASCSMEKMPFDHLAYVIIDPLKVGDLRLKDVVWDFVQNTPLRTQLFNLTYKRLIERRVKSDFPYDHLVNWAEKLSGRLIEDNEPLEKSVPEPLRHWFMSLGDNFKRRVLASWLTYTYNGTIKYMKASI
jgi:hypothetical protein